MYKEVLRNIENIEIWPVISFVIFFLFFLGLLWWTFAVDKRHISHMSNLPMDDDQQPVQSPESQIEKV